MEVTIFLSGNTASTLKKVPSSMPPCFQDRLDEFRGGLDGKGTIQWRGERDRTLVPDPALAEKLFEHEDEFDRRRWTLVGDAGDAHDDHLGADGVA